MFEFLSMMGNYEQRKIENTKLVDCEGNDLILDTCMITDDDEYDYETALEHPKYNNGDWIILEQYHTKEESIEGHNKWIKVFSKNTLPEKVLDVHAGNFAKIFLGIDGEYINKDK